MARRSSLEGEHACSYHSDNAIRVGHQERLSCRNAMLRAERVARLGQILLEVPINLSLQRNSSFLFVIDHVLAIFMLSDSCYYGDLTNVREIVI